MMIGDKERRKEAKRKTERRRKGGEHHECVSEMDRRKRSVRREGKGYKK
jgi:hypothetical protein